MGQPKTFKGLQKENVGREEAIEGSDEIDFNSFDSFFFRIFIHRSPKNC